MKSQGRKENQAASSQGCCDMSRIEKPWTPMNPGLHLDSNSTTTEV